MTVHSGVSYSSERVSEVFVPYPAAWGGPDRVSLCSPKLLSESTGKLFGPESVSFSKETLEDGRVSEQDHFDLEEGAEEEKWNTVFQRRNI